MFCVGTTLASLLRPFHARALFQVRVTAVQAMAFAAGDNLEHRNMLVKAGAVDKLLQVRWLASHLVVGRGARGGGHAWLPLIRSYSMSRFFQFLTHDCDSAQAAQLGANAATSLTGGIPFPAVRLLRVPAVCRVWWH